MKYLYLIFFLLCFVNSVNAQKKSLSPVESKLNDKLCDCISQIDETSLSTKQSANKAFMDCMYQQSALLVELAEEKKISLSNQPAMRKLGEDVGKNLMTQNCQSFMKLAVAMAKDNSDSGSSSTSTGVTEGQLKRIDTKDFSYFIIADATEMEKSFIWLRQFPGSEKFINGANSLVGKQLKIEWQELEVYIPSAKNYFKIKEVVGLEIL